MTSRNVLRPVLLSATLVALLLALPAPPAHAGDANVALRKPASASGSYGIYVPSRGNDDDPASIWNGGTHQACWTVDLQGVHAIQSIVVSSNQFGASGLQTVFQVSSSLDGSSWKAVGPTYTGKGDQTFTIPANGAQMRQIRFCTLPGSTNWATLGELKAFGTPVQAGKPAPPSTAGAGGDAAAGARTAKAVVTSDACQPRFAAISVPAGMIATGFQVRELAAGVDCGRGLPIAEKGWGIARNRGGQLGDDVYAYFRTALGQETRSGPLDALTLGVGEYLVYVKGGKGAHVTLDYVLRQGLTAGPPPSTGGGKAGGGKPAAKDDCDRRTPFGDCPVTDVKTVPSSR